MSLIQLAYPLFLIAGVLHAVQYLRQPRPLHAALLLGLLGLLWMLPNTFILPHALQVMSSLVMLMIVAAVVTGTTTAVAVVAVTTTIAATTAAVVTKLLPLIR